MGARSGKQSKPPTRRRTLWVAPVAVLALVVLAACQPPTLGPAPSLPAAGTCNPALDCCGTTGSGVTYYGNLLYGHDNDQSQDLYLDAMVPTGATGTRPAVIYVHGGGHTGGTKCAGEPQLLSYLVQHGFAVFSVDYPLASSTVHPFWDVPQDVQLAVQWVRTNVATFGVNPNEIGLWGTSAGVDIAFDAAYQAQRQNPAAEVQAVAGWSGGYDFLDEYYRNPANAAHVDRGGADYVGCVDPTDTVCVAETMQASPLTYASRDDPPTLLATSTDYATGCESVEPQNVVQMADALQARGAPVTLETTSACGHATAYWKATIDPPGTGTMIDNLVAFFQKNLGGSPMTGGAPTPLPPKRTTGSIVTAATTCAPTGLTGITYTANVTYGTDFGHPLYADVYRLTGTGTHPAVVLVHGGDFTSGDKCDADVTSAARLLVTQGYVVFSVNYPLATATQPAFPNPVYDLLAGSVALKANAAMFGVDPTRIALWGADAGGNLADEAALAAPLINPSAEVKAAVNYSGVTDIFADLGEYTAVGSATPPENWSAYLGCANPVTITWDATANTCFGLYEQASPALMTDPAASATALLNVTSSNWNGQVTCETTPPRQAEELQLSAAFVGIPTNLAYPTDCTTGFGYLASQSANTLSFLQTQLGT